MVSDGILDAGKNNNLGDNWLIYFLQNIKTTNPKEIEIGRASCRERV